MVKKLFKHEFRYYLRSMLPIYGILIAIAAVGRFIQLFEADNTMYNTLNVISILTYVAGIIGVIVMSYVFTITRYHRNLFTSEGYLSFTLPVTASEHILVKLTTAVATHIASLVVIFLSACVITIGDVLTEVCKAISYIYNLIPDRLVRSFDQTTAAEWQLNIPLFIVEFCLLILVMYLYQMLLFYGCITVGQMSHKNRVLAAVGVYFAYYMATQAIGTAIVIVAQFLPWDTFAEIFYNAPIGCVHTLAIAYIILNLAVATALFFVSRFIIRRKLNLE